MDENVTIPKRKGNTLRFKCMEQQSGILAWKRCVADSEQAFGKDHNGRLENANINDTRRQMQASN
jgi:hypothetical protein